MTNRDKKIKLYGIDIVLDDERIWLERGYRINYEKDLLEKIKITINGKPISAKEFAFDGCHKIYLINTKEDKAQLVEYDYDIFPIEDIKEVYEGSCSLRFIQDMTTFMDIVKQFEKAVFKEVI